MRFPNYQYDLERLSIGLYGVETVYDGSENTLKPLSSLLSVIISIKEWGEVTTIGYGRRGLLTRDYRIATIPIGYVDGIDRHYGNGNISVWVNGTLCPPVGNLCMALFMIDVPDAHFKTAQSFGFFGLHVLL